MKKVELSKGYFALVSDKDYSRVSALNWCAHVRRRKDGSIKNVYAIHNIHNPDHTTTALLMHRFILKVSNPTVEVDHKDHNGLNNQRLNLRKATGQQNKHHSRKRVDNTSGFKGVHWDAARQQWKATIKLDSKTKHLGYFGKVKDAANVYDKAAKKCFGRFAVTN